VGDPHADGALWLDRRTLLVDAFNDFRLVYAADLAAGRCDSGFAGAV
jgi:hypothetical protein